MFIIQCQLLLNFHMHWLVLLLYLTRTRAKATLVIWTGQSNKAAAQVTENVLLFDGALEKFSLYPPCGASVALYVMTCYYQSYLASLWTSSLLLIPPVGLKSTLKHLSN
jgi:hypothetical protein